MNAEHFRVLVVDDNPSDRLLYRMALMLKPGGVFEVSEAEQAQAALDSCGDQLPDCILLDFNMPGMDGLQFLSLLKERYGDLPCAVVMLTGVGDESIAVRAMKSGTADYLPKSENIGEILGHTVISAIEKFRMRRQIAEQQLALEARELQYRTLIEALPQLVWLAGATGEIQYANRLWSEYTGFESLGNIYLHDAIREDDRQRLSAAWHEAVGFNRSVQIELRIRRSADGTDRWHLVRFSPIQEPQGATKWLGTGMDIEDLKQAEMALHKKQKWESIGLLAGGIAHDFNNLLVGILGGASLLAETVTGQEDQSIVKMIVQSGERASQLTGQLLAYSGKAQFFVERLDLSSVVRNSCDLIGPSIPNGIQLSLQTAGPALFIEADRNQIQQVITNLVMNAVEAIPENRPGKVVVRTFTTDLSTELLPEDHLGPNALAAGTYAVLEIQDTGSGMDAETKARIFDPFFSTKFVGRGLGLAAVQGIMRSAKGRIMVDSSPGKGSTFTVLLPIPGVPANSNRPSPSADMSDRNSAGTILVIGDEPVVRQMMSVVLKRAGYQVRTAEDGQAALSIFERQQNSISLVLLDMGMPQMGGADVLRRMRAYGYRVPVVICSGYSEAEVLTQFAGCDFSGFIQKPFRMDELIRRVSVLLRAVPAPQ